MIKRTFTLVDLVFFLGACNFGSLAGPTGTPTVDAVATSAAREAISRATGTQEALNAVASETAESLQATETKIAMQTLTQAYQSTLVANSQATAEAKLTATAVAYDALAVEMEERVNQLFTDGQITRNTGTYRLLPDNEITKNPDYAFLVDTVEFYPTDFVIVSQITLDGGTCGYIFRATDLDNFYFAGVGTAGFPEIGRFVYGQGRWLPEFGVRNLKPILGLSSAEKLEETFTVEVTLVVEGTTFQLFINGESVLRSYDAGLTAGAIGFYLWNANRCKYENTQLWILEE